MAVMGDAVCTIINKIFGGVMEHLLFHEFGKLKSKWSGKDSSWDNKIRGNIRKNAMIFYDKNSYNKKIFFFIEEDGKSHLFFTEDGIFFRSEPLLQGGIVLRALILMLTSKGVSGFSYPGPFPGPLYLPWDSITKCHTNGNCHLNFETKDNKPKSFNIGNYKYEFITDITNCIDEVLNKRDKLISYNSSLVDISIEDIGILDKILDIRPSAYDFKRRAELHQSKNDFKNAIYDYKQSLKCYEEEPDFLHNNFKQYEIWQKLALMEEKSSNFDLARYVMNSAFRTCESRKPYDWSELDEIKVRIRKSFIEQVRQLPYHQKQKIVFVNELPVAPLPSLQLINYDDWDPSTYPVRDSVSITPNILYILNPVGDKQELIQLDEFHKTMLEYKYDETINIAESLGAKKISIELLGSKSAATIMEKDSKRERKTNKSDETGLSGKVGYGATSIGGGTKSQESNGSVNKQSTENHSTEKRNIFAKIKEKIERHPVSNKIYTERDLPMSLEYYLKDGDLTKLISRRLKGTDKHEFILEEKSDCSINQSSLIEIESALSSSQSDEINGQFNVPFVNVEFAEKQKKTFDDLKTNFERQKRSYEETKHISFNFNIEYTQMPEITLQYDEASSKQLNKTKREVSNIEDKAIISWLQKTRDWENKYLGFLGKDINRS